MTIAGIIGIGIIWMVAGLVSGSWFGINQHFPRLSLLQSLALLISSAALGGFLILLKVWLSAWRRTRNVVEAVRVSLSPEERARYREIDLLALSPNAEDRERARQLTREFQQRVSQIRQPRE